MISAHDRKSNGQVDPDEAGANGSGSAVSRPGPARSVEGGVDQTTEGTSTRR